MALASTVRSIRRLPKFMILIALSGWALFLYHVQQHVVNETRSNDARLTESRPSTEVKSSPALSKPIEIKPNEKPRPTSVLEEDYIVRDCVSGIVRGTWLPPKETVLLTPALYTGRTFSYSPEEKHKRFQEVHDKQQWGFPVSGDGAKLENAMNVIATLHRLVNEIKFRYDVTRVRILDLPCGDLTFMQAFLKDRNEDVDYTGIDVVPALIEAHTKRYAGNPYVRFHVRDVAVTGLNESFDLIHTRDLFHHIIMTDVFAILSAYSKSGSKYLLANSQSNFQYADDNNHENAGSRHINLEAPPVSLTPPLCFAKDHLNGYRVEMLFKLPLRSVVGCDKPKKHDVNGARGWDMTDYYSCVDWKV